MPGVAVFGDETDGVGVVHLNKSLKDDRPRHFSRTK
jgi:hypothetical protein